MNVIFWNMSWLTKDYIASSTMKFQKGRFIQAINGILSGLIFKNIWLWLWISSRWMKNINHKWIENINAILKNTTRILIERGWMNYRDYITFVEANGLIEIPRFGIPWKMVALCSSSWMLHTCAEILLTKLVHNDHYLNLFQMNISWQYCIWTPFYYK